MASVDAREKKVQLGCVRAHNTESVPRFSPPYQREKRAAARGGLKDRGRGIESGNGEGNIEREEERGTGRGGGGNKIMR